MTPRAHHTGSRASRRGGGWGEPAGRRYEMRPAGLLYVGVTLFIAIGAVNSQNNLLFWLFGMAVGAIVVSGIVSGSAMMGLRVRRVAPASIEAGGQGALSYELRHRGRRAPAFALLIRELGAEDNTGRGRIEVGWGHVEHLAPGGRARARAGVEAMRRGGVTLDRFEVSTTFPFGLFRKSVIFSQPAVLVVIPPRIELREMLIETVSSQGDRGTPRSGRIGLSDEFFGLRAYVPGDSPRMISWKRSAALGDLVVRQASSPTPPRVIIALARDVRDAEPGRAEVAVALAASLAVVGCARGFLVAVEAEWGGLATPLGGGAFHAARCLRELGLLDLSAGRTGVAGTQFRRGLTGRILITTGARGPDGDRAGSLVISTESPSAWLAGGASLPRVLDAGAAATRPARAARRRPRNAGPTPPVKEVA